MGATKTISTIRLPTITILLGDVRDQDRLRRALEQIDTVVHAAALKQVPQQNITPWNL